MLLKVLLLMEKQACWQRIFETEFSERIHSINFKQQQLIMLILIILK